MRNQEEKIEFQKKYIEERLWGISLFWLHTLLMSFFIAFFVYYLPFVYSSFTKKIFFLLQGMVGFQHLFPAPLCLRPCDILIKFINWFT